MYPILKEGVSIGTFQYEVPIPPTIILKTLMGRNLKSTADCGMPF